MFKPTKKQQERLIEQLAKARKRAQLSQVKLSLAIGAASSFVNKIEAGQRELGFFEFEALAKAMNEDPIELARRIWN